MKHRKTLEMSCELSMYWRLVADAARRERSDPRDPEIKLIYDELETLSDYTNWPQLRDKIKAHVQRYHATRKTRLKLVCASSA